MKAWRQVVLHHADDTELVCWIEDDPRVERGTKLTLKETGDVLWEVVKVYGFVSKEAPRKTWRVGGLT